MKIEVRIEGKRGCGYRSVGGLYLIGGRISAPCCRFPIPLARCPACDHGIKPSRGWTWIQPSMLVDGCPDYHALEQALRTVAYDRPADPAGLADVALQQCKRTPECISDPKRWRASGGCGLRTIAKDDRAGLIWVGERYYSTPAAFLAEADAMGVSRKIPQLPRGFEPGKTRVYLAHRRAIRVPRTTAPLQHALLSEAAAQAVEQDVSADGWAPGIFASFIPSRVEQVVSDKTPESEVKRIRARGVVPVIVKRDEGAQGVIPEVIDSGA